MEKKKKDKYENVPTIEELLEWEQDGVAKATDNCITELDGTCIHGCKSWFIVLGLI